MFYIRELNGAISPYVPGIVRQRRLVDPIVSVPGVGTVLNQPVLAGEFQRTSMQTESTSEGIAAYQRVVQQDTPRRRVLLAEDLMTGDLTTILQTATLKDAHQLFAARRFRHIPVLNENAELVGMLSDRDLLRCAAIHHEGAHADKQPWTQLQVRTIMSQPVLVADRDTDMREVARVMFEERVGCLPIVDQQQLIGIITRSDVLRTLLVQAPLELWR